MPSRSITYFDDPLSRIFQRSRARVAKRLAQHEASWRAKQRALLVDQPTVITRGRPQPSNSGYFGPRPDDRE